MPFIGGKKLHLNGFRSIRGARRRLGTRESSVRSTFGPGASRFRMPPAQLQRLLHDARAHHRAGRLAEAAAHYLRVRTADSKCFEAWHGSGALALATGRADEAEPLLVRALELQPNATQTAFCLGVARVARGDTVGAEAVLRGVVDAAPSNAEAWHYLALAHKTAGRFEAALAARRRAGEVKPAVAEGGCEGAGDAEAVLAVRPGHDLDSPPA